MINAECRLITLLLKVDCFTGFMNIFLSTEAITRVHWSSGHTRCLAWAWVTSGLAPGMFSEDVPTHRSKYICDILCVSVAVVSFRNAAGEWAREGWYYEI